MVEKISIHPNQNSSVINISDINIQSYLVYLPEDYSPIKTYPAIIFLHGSGERGTNIDDVKKAGLPKELEFLKDFPFIVCAPQCLSGSFWNSQMLNILADLMLSEYNIDPSRVYLTGISMGGYGTWLWAANNPERFAAIAPICGGGNPSLAHRLKGVPVWTFHGAKDNVVPIKESEIMVEALKQVGAEIKFTIYPKAQHDSWTETYKNPGLYEWFLQHRKNS